MNLGHRLAQWFVADFGSTQCRAITQCDFTTSLGVTRYVENDGTARCRAMAGSVAHNVEGMITEVGQRYPNRVGKTITTTAAHAT